MVSQDIWIRCAIACFWTYIKYHLIKRKISHYFGCLGVTVRMNDPNICFGWERRKTDLSIIHETPQLSELRLSGPSCSKYTDIFWLKKWGKCHFSFSTKNIDISGIKFWNFNKTLTNNISFEQLHLFLFILLPGWGFIEPERKVLALSILPEINGFWCPIILVFP